MIIDSLALPENGGCVKSTAVWKKKKDFFQCYTFTWIKL